jgi:predicted small lipoprotein YifL
MKKALTLLSVLAMFSLVACGPSEAEEAKEKADIEKQVESETDKMLDSINKAANAMVDTVKPSGDSVKK